MNSKVPMTKRGANALREQLRHLKSVERPAIIEAIAVARELGHGYFAVHALTD